MPRRRLVLASALMVIILALPVFGQAPDPHPSPAGTYHGRIVCGHVDVIGPKDLHGDRCSELSKNYTRHFEFHDESDVRGYALQLNWTSENGTVPELRLVVSRPAWGSAVDAVQGPPPLRVTVAVPAAGPSPFNVTIDNHDDPTKQPLAFNQTFILTVTRLERSSAGSGPAVPAVVPAAGETGSDSDDPEQEEPVADLVREPANAAAEDAVITDAEGDVLILVALAVAGGVAALGLVHVRWPLARVFFGLFSRLNDDEVLEHPRRRLINDAVRAQPGVGHEELRRMTKMSNGAFEHHLGILLSRKLLVRRVWENRRTTYHPPGAAPRGGVEDVRPMRTRVLKAVKERPGIAQAELARHLGVSVQRLHYHVRRLEGTGAIVVRRNGPSAACYPSVE